MPLSFPLRTVMMPDGKPLVFEHGILIAHEEDKRNWFVMVNGVSVSEEMKQYFTSGEVFDIIMVPWEGSPFIGKVQLKIMYEEDAYMNGRALLQEPVQRVIELDGEKIPF
ncbi:hypothetical protein [Thalassobacillus devorans]|uniref:hypothetical protein n=1 Tax=Thalassobacillus devorans TaxID=279813 RepID=UPI00048C4A82|nr:hypothetical protein [Thalassobacillus devorans]